MLRTISLLLLIAWTALGADAPTVHSLTDLAKDPGSAQFREALAKAFKEADVQMGVAWIGEGPDFFWAVEGATQPALFVDNAPRPPMQQVAGTKRWIASGQVRPVGRLHSFHYIIDGKKFGGRNDLPAHTADSYAHPGVPQGKLSEKMVFSSKIYDGMKCDYWVYVPAQYDPKTPAALMVWQDGQAYNQRDSPTNRTLNVLDNLIAQKKLPVMIGVFISPGDVTDATGGETYRFVKAYSDESKRTLKDSMRSVEYDTVTDRYARFLRDEILAEISAHYNIRKDSYSRGITGLSSGGICAFNVAWQQPEQFSRVISWIGSFAGIQWRPGVLDGGNVFPNMVRIMPKRNLRVWLQDGGEDLENNYGSWPLQNVQLANSLKMREYDFHLSFSHGSHGSSHGSAEFPEEMTWLWRDYDPAKTEQTYEMDPAEKAKPFFRIESLNRGSRIGNAEPEYEMTTYVMGLATTGPKWTPEQTPETLRIQEEHMANIRKMAAAGKLVVAGPFGDKGDLRGVFIFQGTSMEEARMLVDADPAVQAGRLTVTLHPWYAAKGIKVDPPK